MADISQVKLPNGDIYTLKDDGALQLTGGQVTGPVSFGDSVTIDELTAGDLVVNGAGSFTNNLQVNTINGVTVGNSPKFTDTPMTVTTTGSGNAVTAVSASGNVITVTKDATYSNNAGTITSVTTTAGQHTTINVTSGAANFNVPTHTSHLTNDSGYKKFHIVEASIPLMGGTSTIDSTYTQILNWIEAGEEVIIINTQSSDTRYYFHGISDTILMFYSLSGWELDIKSNDIRHYGPSWITLDDLPIYDGTVE